MEWVEFSLENKVYVYAADGSGEQDFIYGEAVV